MGPKPLAYLETLVVEEMRAEHAHKAWEAQRAAHQKVEEIQQEIARRAELAKKAGERAILLTEATKVVFQWIERTVPLENPLHVRWTDDIIRELRRQGASDALIRDAMTMAIQAGYGFTPTLVSTQAQILVGSQRSDREPASTLGGPAGADAGALRIEAEKLEVRFQEARRMGDREGMRAAMEEFVGLLNQAKTLGDQGAAKQAATELAKAIDDAVAADRGGAPADGRERVGGAPVDVPPSHQAPAPHRRPVRSPADLPPPRPAPRGPHR
jgi:hypothetical protein